MASVSALQTEYHGSVRFSAHYSLYRKSSCVEIANVPTLIDLWNYWQYNKGVGSFSLTINCRASFYYPLRIKERDAICILEKNV